ncbi:MAG: hypothetical protein K6G78_01410 [bacterium]|nr:hypothetical protein [bacterium]
MNRRDFYVLPGDCKAPDFGAVPAEAIAPIVTFSGEHNKRCLLASASWIKAPLEVAGLRKHASDELHMFVGNNPDAPEKLSATVSFQIENDTLTITESCFVFIPKGVAHGNVKVLDMEKPFIHFVSHPQTSEYASEPAKATAPAGKYAGNHVERYEPVSGIMPEAPEGFLSEILWIDGAKLAGAPYMECVWFHQSNDDGPPEHVHADMDEFVGFLGNDPENPGQLGAHIRFKLDGKYIDFHQPTLIFAPRNVAHSPILVPSLSRDVVHFTGGNLGSYIRN